MPYKFAVIQEKNLDMTFCYLAYSRSKVFYHQSHHLNFGPHLQYKHTQRIPVGVQNCIVCLPHNRLLECVLALTASVPLTIVL